MASDLWAMVRFFAWMIGTASASSVIGVALVYLLDVDSAVVSGLMGLAFATIGITVGGYIGAVRAGG